MDFLPPHAPTSTLPDPPVSSGGSTVYGNGSKVPSTKCRTPADT